MKKFDALGFEIRRKKKLGNMNEIADAILNLSNERLQKMDKDLEKSLEDLLIGKEIQFRAFEEDAIITMDYSIDRLNIVYKRGTTEVIRIYFG